MQTRRVNRRSTDAHKPPGNAPKNRNRKTWPLSSGRVHLHCCRLLNSLFLFFSPPSLSCSAPWTDKPPKILFPSENKISNMELQLGKSITGLQFFFLLLPPSQLQPLISVSFPNDGKWMTLQILRSSSPRCPAQIDGSAPLNAKRADGNCPCPLHMHTHTHIYADSVHPYGATPPSATRCLSTWMCGHNGPAAEVAVFVFVGWMFAVIVTSPTANPPSPPSRHIA